ncbi:putative Dynein axonemal heavy chain 6 [Blattamonas nauphoetae]|uniref:Dynein axonemal heavy chain 6 n=1 Tax=Blattamonas nauphoetae TaxID=2049346 RepID=A0ABQ9YKY4_9EUKA|nr:putative Dynein axonemal heavy chain 6 [Blattamonas nauphoetae]
MRASMPTAPTQDLDVTTTQMLNRSVARPSSPSQTLSTVQPSRLPPLGRPSSQTQNRPRSSSTGTDPNDLTKDHTKKLVIQKKGRDSLDSFLLRIQENPDSTEFVYGKVGSSKYEQYNPYKIEIIQAKNIPDDCYFTVSGKGVTTYVQNRPEFLPFEKWKEERNLFNIVSSISTFRDFRLWRCFVAWESRTRRDRISKHFKLLKENHFFTSDALHLALIQINALCLQFIKTKMFVVNDKLTYTVAEFVTEMNNQSDEFKDEFESFYDNVEDIIANACNVLLEQKGFNRNEDKLERALVDNSRASTRPSSAADQSDLRKDEDVSFFVTESQPQTQDNTPLPTSHKGSSSKTLQQEKGEDISYTRLAAKHLEYHRLSRFIEEVDYIVMNMRHTMIVDATKDLLETLQKRRFRVECRPPQMEALNQVKEQRKARKALSKATRAMMKGKKMTNYDNQQMMLEEEYYDDYEEYEEEEEAQHIYPPLFRTTLDIVNNKLAFGDDGDAVQECVNAQVERFVNDILDRERSLLAPRFKVYTSFDSGEEDDDDDDDDDDDEEDGPEGVADIIDSRLNQDKDYQQLKSSIQQNLIGAFQNIVQLGVKFRPFLKVYISNNAVNPDEIKERDPPTTWYSDQLDEFAAHLTDAQNLPSDFEVEMVTLNVDSLKRDVEKSAQTCIDTFHRILPEIAAEKRTAQSVSIREALQAILNKPDSVEDYVQFLSSVTRIQEHQAEIRHKYDLVEAFYQMMRENNVDVSSSDQANLQLMEKTMAQLNTLLGQTENTLDEQTHRFNRQNNTQIEQLKQQVQTLKSAANEPQFLTNPEERDQTFDEIKKLELTLSKVRNQADKCTEYQTLFNVKLDSWVDLDEVEKDVKWKKTLWESLTEWRNKVDDWKTAPMMTLDKEAIRLSYGHFLKTTSQLERELPPNNATQQLRMEITDFGKLIPIIDAFHNPDLKLHHQMKMRLIITESPDPFPSNYTLGWLLESNALAKRTDIVQVSEEAAQEAVLVTMLHKILDKWQSMEIHTKHFRNENFLLVDVDDILREYDDSIVQLETIRASQYSTQIKEQVDQFTARLMIFSDVLDQWILFQQKWLALEPVFQSDDLLKDHVKMFQECNKFWQEFMKRTHDMPSALRITQQPGLANIFRQHNATLDKIQIALEGLLNTKRAAFGRFFFLPNDDLLEILKEGKNPVNVMSYMNKLFDNIKTLQFSNLDEPRKLEIVGMVSSEGETVDFGEHKLNPRGKAVEVWLKMVEQSMEKSLHGLLRQSVKKLFQISSSRNQNQTVPSAIGIPLTQMQQWILSTKGQLVIAAAQILWASTIEQALASEKPLEEMQKALRKTEMILDQLTDLARSNLDSLQRISVGALTVIEVHARDIIEEMIMDNILSHNDFDWQKRLRYYWDQKEDTCVIRQTKSSFKYGYEYLGCTPRLVITPLTDQCYITLTSALHLKMGGAPAGPAGTGKTETTKDLAKAVARQCVVFNCSDGLNVGTMAQMFAGMCQAGAWFCFDEFNRIDIEVLSVVAQQIREIQDAQQANLHRFVFQGKEIPLNTNCAVFITMNPGYAGRTELPDNLKALFRPVSMMIPDYALIAEIMLYSEGFKTAKILARKMTQLYKLSSEQLSQQSHYDFGMRAVKSVLVMAGRLRRDNSDLGEDVVLIRAMCESNLPKFLADDIPLFNGIVGDLFPEVSIPDNDYGELQAMLECVIADKCYQHIPYQLKKTIELFDTFGVRHGVMLVGPTRGGKTVCREILAETMTRLRTETHSLNDAFQVIQQKEMNPKSISVDEMFGCFSDLTQEWKEGLLSFFVQNAVMDDSPTKKWIIFDGPVDTLWVESLNTVLDDSKTLCLPNRKRIKLNPTVALLFEVENLDEASPATVSRCGMVYIDPAGLPWITVVQRWMQQLDDKLWPPSLKEFTLELFEATLPGLLDAVGKLKEDIHQPVLTKVQNVIRIMEAVLTPKHGFTPQPDKDEEDVVDAEKKKPGKSGEIDWQAWIRAVFLFACVWGVGGALVESAHEEFDTAIKLHVEGVFMPSTDTVYDLTLDYKQRTLVPWLIPDYVHNPTTPFFEILVPTIDSVRMTYLMNLLVETCQPVMITGETGVGKSSIIGSAFTLPADTVSEEDKPQQKNASGLIMEHSLIPVNIGFSAQTSSNRTQEMIEHKLQNRRDHYSAPPNSTVILILDDFNMPAPDKFGSQPPLELIRQLLGTGGWYDRTVLQFRPIKGTTSIASCGPPGGGRNAISPRLSALFTQFRVPQPTDRSLFQIFNSILTGFTNQFDFPSNIKDLVPMVVRASTELYAHALSELKPTPSKSHYVFNLRDLSKVVQGVMNARPNTIEDEQAFLRLWSHESQRVFADRLVSADDKTIITTKICALAKTQFHVNWNHEEMFLFNSPKIWVDFQKMGETIPRPYEEVPDIKKLQNGLVSILEEYNTDCAMKRMKESNLVFFDDAIQHLARITRIFRQARGNALLVGVGGCGKQSLTRLSSFISGCACFEITLSRNYGLNEFREDLRKLYTLAGAEGKPTVFLLNDTQIASESFLEDINCILSSGDVPGLFDAQQKDIILKKLRASAGRDGKVPENPDAAMQFLINRVRDQLHIVMCMSPIGNTFRNRCRMFPSLVNCCTIDWVDNWPESALLSVAMRSFQTAHLGTDPVHKLKDKDRTTDVVLAERIAKVAVTIHKSIDDSAAQFFSETKRKLYVTPALFLEMIDMFFTILEDRTRIQMEQIGKYEGGMKTLADTKVKVAEMQEELKKLEPVLVNQSEALRTLMEQIAQDSVTTEEIRISVSEEEEIVRTEAAKAKSLADDAQSELDKIMPVFLEANKALESLSKAAVTEVKSFANPPEPVKRVMNAVCTLFKKKPDWDNARGLMNQSNFIQMLINFNVDEIDAAMDQKMRPFLDDPEFSPEKVDSVSKAAANICQWVVAIVEFARVSKIIEPKKKAAAEAQAQLKELTDKLDAKMNQLKDLEKKLNDLKSLLEQKKQEAAKTEADIQQTRNRFQNAEKLVSSLGDEGERWSMKLKELNENSVYIQGSSLLSAASLSYLGPFSADYRRRIVQFWTDECQNNFIPCGTSDQLFSLQKTLSSEVETRDWTMQGLPSDQLSLDNAVVVTRSRKWPLMIDPQGQANRWIRAKERDHRLKVMRPSDNHIIRDLSNCIRFGQPVLLEEIGEQLDPQLEPVLSKQLIKQGGRTVIHINDQDVDYNPAFRLYITTKLSNPHYLPDMFIKTTIINFTVTSAGLEEQLLAEVVKNEKKEIEDAKDDLVRGMAADAKLLMETEAKILQLMKEKKVNELLDDTSLIDILEQSKRTSTEIKERVKQSEQTEIELIAARNQYVPMSVRGALLYFCIVDLAALDPMYQFSLQYFQSIFKLALTQTEKKPTLKERLRALIDNLTEMIYSNVSRGLFERHRMLFSFYLTIRIQQKARYISSKEWSIFMKGADAFKSAVPQTPINFHTPIASPTFSSGESFPPVPCTPQSSTLNPFPEDLDENRWRDLIAMENDWQLFKGISESMMKEEEQQEPTSFTSGLAKSSSVHNLSISSGRKVTKPSMAQPSHNNEQSTTPVPKQPTPWLNWIRSPQPYSAPLPETFRYKLTPFQKLILIRIILPQSLNVSMIEYVKMQLGQTFAESPSLNLTRAYSDSSESSPIIFILSSGADPTPHFQRLAQQMNYSNRLRIISLGQGQGPIAVKMLAEATEKGDWVFLQNCHLAASWMPELERICLSYSLADTKPSNSSFRLWLSAMPSAAFPVSVLQNGIKLTNEPPAGVKANIQRSISSLSKEEYETGVTGKRSFIWRRLVMGLAFFHALVQERKKYGALGWNIQYEFNESDYEISKSHLKLYLTEMKEGSEIPWKALRYMTGIVNYGGRVTDEWDKRILSALLALFYTESIVTPNRSFELCCEDREKRIEEVPLIPTPVSSDEVSMTLTPAGLDRTDDASSLVSDLQASSSNSPYLLPPDLKTYTGVTAFIDRFPLNDKPGLFGMHQNAEYSFQLAQTDTIMKNLTMMLPKGEEEESPPPAPADPAIVLPTTKTENDKPEVEEQPAEKDDKDVKGKPRLSPLLVPKQIQSAPLVSPSTQQVLKSLSQPTKPARTKDDEVLDKVKNILSKLPDVLKREEAAPGVLPPVTTINAVPSKADLKRSVSSLDLRGKVPDSLCIVLSQEMDRMNALLVLVRVTLVDLQRAIAGLVVMSAQLDAVYAALLTNTVPDLFAANAYPSLLSLTGWVNDLINRETFLRDWLRNGAPSVFWLPGFFFQQGFLTAVLQTYARKYKYPIDSLRFKYSVMAERTAEDIHSPPSDGVYVSGLFIEGARWNSETMKLDEGRKGERDTPMPIIHFLPQQNYVPDPSLYNAPLYKTTTRYGVLSTTGHSTNFITPLALPTDENPQHWVLRGVALLCEPYEK